MKICIYTLGCKVNLYESDSLKLALTKLGHEVVSDLQAADVYIINTCAVTNEAERKSRQVVAKCNKLSPNCRIIISGCASQKNFEQFKGLENVRFIGGVKNKLAIIDSLEKEGVEILPLDDKYDEKYFPSSSTTRAHIKIQDGCNNFCSYCIIPYLRGRSRSRALDDILGEVQELSKTAKEIVVTGIDISDYKIDGQKAITRLVKSLDSSDYRVRLGSLESSIVADDFLEMAKNMKNFCPHFHLSLQSGCNRILRLMNRHYKAEDYLQNVKKIRKHFKNPAITTDIIVGFPTETEEDFKQTLKFVKKVKFSNIHVFPYSRREGTAAAKMKQVPNDQKMKRVKELMNLAEKLHSKYIKKCSKDCHELLIETIVDGKAFGYTENYIRCFVEDDNFHPNEIVKVKIIGQKDGVAECKLIKNK